MTKSLRWLGESNKLLLRAPREKDIEPIVSLWTDPAVTRHIGGPRERAMVEEHFRQYAADPRAFVRDEAEWWWSIVERDTEVFIGLCGLIQKEVDGQIEVDLNYFLLPAFWGQGYAVEAASRVVQYAFADLSLPSLIAIIHPENTGSIVVARKLGMHFERDIVRDGATRQVYRLFSLKKSGVFVSNGLRGTPRR